MESINKVNISLTIPVIRSVGGDDLAGYTLAQHQAWDALSTYQGDYKEFTATLKGPPEQLLPVSIASKIIEIFTEKFKAGGYSPLEIKVWANTAPTFYTNYKVDFKVYNPESSAAAGSAGLHQVQAIAVIVAAVAAALIMIAIAIVVWKVVDVVGKAGPVAVWAIIALLAFFLLTSGKREKAG